MIVLFTDFSCHDPYVGQMKAVLHRMARGVQVVDLFHEVPLFDIKAGAYLLPVYVSEFEAGDVFLCVVDPGVGSSRGAAVVKVDGKWFVGPDNGLFNVLASRADEVSWFDLTWCPETLSSSFHGRDLFAPVAAMLAEGQLPDMEECDSAEKIDLSWSEDLEQIVYFDHYGNAFTGVRSSTVSQSNILEVSGVKLKYARTFSDVGLGDAFWYENSNGLVEIAVNQGSARKILGLQLGVEVRWL